MAQTWKARTLELGQTNLARNTSPGTKIYFTSMVNCEKAVDIVFWLRSKLDVSVTVQLVGSDMDSGTEWSGHYRIGDCFNVPPGNVQEKRISIPVGFMGGNQWHPFLGIECTTMERSGVNGTIALSCTVRENVDVTDAGQIPQNYQTALPADNVYKVTQPDTGAGAPAAKPGPAPVKAPATLKFPIYNIFGGKGL